MSIATRQDAAHHESGHAAALAVRTGILTEHLFVGCKLDGTNAAGINDAPRIPITEMSSWDLIIYNFAGHAAEHLFNPNANRNGALRDDIIAEKVLRRTCHPDFLADMLDLAEQLTTELVQTHWKCIQELAAAILAVPPRTVTILGEDYHVHKLCASKIAEILSDNRIQTPKQFGSDYTNAIFEKHLERQVTNTRLAERSPIVATEFRNWRRFSEMKVPTLEVPNHQMWLDYFGTASAEEK
jgi:hypothetical protein